MIPEPEAIQDRLGFWLSDEYGVEVSARPYPIQWVGWGNVPSGGVDPVTGTISILIRDPDDPRQRTHVLIDSHFQGTERDFQWLGYGIKHKKGGIIFDAAFGYVSGYPLSAILWFVLTRSIPRRIRALGESR